jgi:hypothetical protein
MSLKETFLMSPLSVPGCQLWLDTGDTSKMSLSGSDVLSITDKSPSSLVFSASATRPVRSSTTYNGFSPIQFSGSSFLLNSTFTYTLNSRSAFIVAGETTIGNNNGVLSFATSGTDYNSTSAMAYETGHKPVNQMFQAVSAFGAGGYAISVAGSTATPFAVYGETFGSGTAVLYSNGTQAATASTGQVFTNSTGLYLGARMVGGSVANYLTGVIAEVILFNRPLTASERQKIEGYLAWKWGLQSNLPSTHPFRTYRPVNGLSVPIPLSYNNPKKTVNLEPFNPRSISGCQLWLDAADLSTLIFSGSNITQWNDKSGSGLIATPTNSNVWLSNANQYNGVYVNNNNNTNAPGTTKLNINTNFMNGTSYSIFSVIQLTTSNQYQTIFSDGRGSSGETRLQFGNTQTFDVLTNTTLRGVTPINLTTSRQLVQCDSLSSGIFVYVNGSIIGSNTTSGTLYSSDTGELPSIGGPSLSPADNRWMTGWFFEVIVHSALLSTAQRQQIEGYLAWKWGLTSSLPANHPFRTPLAPFPLPSIPRKGGELFFNPRTISGIQFWLDVADAGNRSVVGTSVSQVNDKSGNGYNATQTTAGSRPTLAATNLIQFANNTYLDFPQAAINNTTRYALFLVFNPIASVNWILQKQFNGVGSYNMLSMTNFWQNNTGITNYLYWGPHANTGVLNSGTALSQNTLQLIEVLFDGTTLSFYRNGILLNTVTSGATLSIVNQTSATNNTIGSWRPDGGIQNSGVTNFLLGELVYHNVAFTTVQRQAMEGYLAWKWRLQANLPSTHPFKLFPPSP